MTQSRWVYAALLSFTIGFVAFWPRLLLIVDEERYVSQAVAFAHGGTTLPERGVVFPPVTGMISNYPPGTSLLQAPFVALGGWRFAALASVLSLVIATLATMRWLRAQGSPEGFALVVPGFVGAAFFGRIAMSDVPAAALVALTGMFLWQSGRRVGPSFVAGLCAGLVLLFREPVALIVAPLALGALVRRRCSAAGLIIGGAVAIALRMLAAAAFFGSPFYLRDPGIGFSFSSIGHTVPLYAVILLVLLPGAAALPFVYRGERRVEIVSAFAAYVLLFLLYGYDAMDMNGGARGIMLTARFMVPLAPLVAIMAADVWPRWHATAAQRLPFPPRVLSAAGGIAASLVAFAVHPLAARQESQSLTVQRAIQGATRPERPVVTNTDATLKFLSPSYSARRVIVLAASTDSLDALTARYGPMDIVVLERADANAFRREAAVTERFLGRAQDRCTLRVSLDSTFADAARLRVFDLRDCR